MSDLAFGPFSTDEKLHSLWCATVAKKLKMRKSNLRGIF